jgi:ATP-dependent helicase/nuclease subunit A
MNITDVQHRAIHARGNVLVSAGAGTGKTRTLVERCLSCLLDEKNPASIDEILMVTFTEAAASEMRRRIRERLEQQQQRCPDAVHWQEQLALFESAHIGTLHGFCLQLVRHHFYELGLDPQLAVLAEEDARQLADETLDHLLQQHYSKTDAPALAVQKLIQVHGGGRDLSIRALVFQLYHYTQTLPDPAAWVSEQLRVFTSAEPVVWRAWFQQASTGFAAAWATSLETAAASNPIAARCLAALRKLPAEPSPEAFACALADIAAAREDYPRGKQKAWITPLTGFFTPAAFLSSLVSLPGRDDPLLQDWTWVRHHMVALLGLLREFSEAFAQIKREMAVLDFHDLEQFSLRLLWNPTSGQPTEVARAWRQRLRFVFVDEYQDINAAQDKIVECLARESSEANRFLVGDVKQSIYRFRLASPAIFQRYASDWTAPEGQVIRLVENFRAREGVLHCINSMFGALLTRDLGGVEYREGNALEFGAPDERLPLRAAANTAPPVELRLLLKKGRTRPSANEEPGENPADLEELLDAEKEARLVAMRLQQLHAEQLPIWDEAEKAFRAVRWGDMAILLRAPARKAQSYAKEFARLTVPLQLARTGFYQTLEVLDLFSLLQLLDNPLQDIPALAVLRSPLVGLTLRDLAEIRLVSVKGPFWAALNQWYISSPPAGTGDARSDARSKVGSFLQRFSRWRRMAQQASLSRCLETVLNETHYDSWLLSKPNGLQRHANVHRLISIARQFDQFQRQGLFRFLKYLQAQQSAENEPEVPVAVTEDTVRLMSIHQSKGLEFPVVVMADLGKPFNTADLRAEVILDEQYGLCPHVKPPDTHKRYPSLAHWLGARRQLQESLSEELRLLYVGTTRARDHLILTGSITQTRLEKFWNTADVTPDKRASARSYLDWLGCWFQSSIGVALEEGASGKSPLVSWSVHDDSVTGLAALKDPTPEPEPKPEPEPNPLTGPDTRVLEQLDQRLSWRYPFSSATQQPAKTSVSALRRQTATEDTEAAALPSANIVGSLSRGPRVRGKLDAAEIGRTHHLFLQFLSMAEPGTRDFLSQECDRMLAESRLTPEQANALDLDALAHFWMSGLGRQIQARAQLIHRELAFTARFSVEELAQVQNNPAELDLASRQEFVLVQGVADLVVIAEEEICLVDFKTDHLSPKELPDRVAAYRIQLQLYALALSRIYRRPVTESWLHFIQLRQSVPIATELSKV